MVEREGRIVNEEIDTFEFPIRNFWGLK